MAVQQRQDDDARARNLSKLDAIVLESFISPSQEEQLRQLSEWESFESQKESSFNFLSSSPQTTPTSSRLSAQDKFTVGCHPTIICTPSDIQNPDGKEEEEEEAPANANEDDDSFENKFESDRDISLNTQSQNIIIKSFAFGGLILHDHYPSPVRLEPALPESSSVSSKRGNSNSNSKKNISPKPASCRRILDKEEKEKTQMETTHNANTLPDIVEDSPVDMAKPATQLGATTRIGRYDSSSALNFSPFDTTQLPPNLDTQCFQGYAQTDSEMPFIHNLQEEQGETSEGEEIRGCRVLPPYFSAYSVQGNTPTDLEKDTPMGLERDSQRVPKRRRKEPKLFPETLMDVVMHFSREPPVGSEDVDIVEAALKAGMTFPPPLSRHRFQA